jgi:hypothetical protein
MRVIIKQHPGTGLWVSSDGHVVMPPCHKFPKFRWVLGSKNSRGYLQVQFRGKLYLVSRLICEAFHGIAPADRPTCDHIDRNHLNNRADNLRWASYKTQNNNRQICEDSAEKHGVRECEDPAAYKRAYRARNPGYVVRQTAVRREWQAKQKELGRRYRRCPDGSRHWLTDAEFNVRFGNESHQLPLF